MDYATLTWPLVLPQVARGRPVEMPGFQSRTTITAEGPASTGYLGIASDDGSVRL